MATNRVLAGNRSTGGYGLYVSKANSNVLTCDRKELLFDSSQKRGGEVYAGGSQSSIAGSASQSFLSTGSKDALGYIPLVMWTEDKRGERAIVDGDDEFWRLRQDMIETSSSTISPKSLGQQIDPSTTASSGIYNRESNDSCTNIKFMVLKIPCAYGYMTSANFDT